MNNKPIIGIKFIPYTTARTNMKETINKIQRSEGINVIDKLEGVYIVVDCYKSNYNVKIRIDGEIVVYSSIDSEQLLKAPLSEYEKLLNHSKKILNKFGKLGIVNIHFKNKINIVYHGSNMIPDINENLIDMIRKSFPAIYPDNFYSYGNHIIAPFTLCKEDMQHSNDLEVIFGEQGREVNNGL